MGIINPQELNETKIWLRLLDFAKASRNTNTKLWFWVSLVSVNNLTLLTPMDFRHMWAYVFIWIYLLWSWFHDIWWGFRETLGCQEPLGQRRKTGMTNCSCFFVFFDEFDEMSDFCWIAFSSKSSEVGKTLQQKCWTSFFEILDLKIQCFPLVHWIFGLKSIGIVRDFFLLFSVQYLRFVLDLLKNKKASVNSNHFRCDPPLKVHLPSKRTDESTSKIIPAFIRSIRYWILRSSSLSPMCLVRDKIATFPAMK